MNIQTLTQTAYDSGRSIHVALDAAPRSTPCSACFHRRNCLPAALPDGEDATLARMYSGTARVRKGGVLFEAGSVPERVYVVHTGSFKSVMSMADGRQRIVAFHEPGDVMGLEGFSGISRSDVVALEPSEACEIDLRALEDAAARVPALQRQLRRLMGASLVQAQQDQFAIGSMLVKERLARFLLNLSAKYRSRGLAYDEFTLRMTREDIGDYLGFRLETVSRVFSELQHDGLIALNRRQVRIVDRAALAALLDPKFAMDWKPATVAAPALRRDAAARGWISASA